MLFMVIEHYRAGQAPAIYRRFREKGRMAPDGVRYVTSWVDEGFRRCFQVMEAESRALLSRWTAHGDDLVDFEIVPVQTSQDASAAMLPVACTLTPEELTERRYDLLPGLLSRAAVREPTPGGFRWRFAPAEGLVAAIAEVVEAERRCCRFLRFELAAEPGDGPVWLSVTGPEGTREFLEGVTHR